MSSDSDDDFGFADPETKPTRPTEDKPKQPLNTSESKTSEPAKQQNGTALKKEEEQKQQQFNQQTLKQENKIKKEKKEPKDLDVSVMDVKNQSLDLESEKPENMSFIDPLQTEQENKSNSQHLNKLQPSSLLFTDDSQLPDLNNPYAVTADTKIPEAPNPFEKKSFHNRDQNDFMSGFAGQEFGIPERGGDFRGRGRGRGRGGYRGGRGGFNNFNGGDRNYGNQNYERSYGGRSNYEGSNFGGRDNYQQQSFPPQYVPPPAQLKTESKVQSTLSENPVPNVRFCWPMHRLYCKKIPVSFVFKGLNNYKSQQRGKQITNGSILVLPYKTEDFQYYGGHIVGFSEVNYRQKIIDQKDKIRKGVCYISSQKGNDYFDKFAFIKVEEGTEKEDFKQGIQNLRAHLIEQSKIPREKIVIAVDEVFKDIGQTFMYVIEHFPNDIIGVQMIEFNVSSAECFKYCGIVFSEVMAELVQRKQLAQL